MAGCELAVVVDAGLVVVLLLLSTGVATAAVVLDLVVVVVATVVVVVGDVVDGCLGLAVAVADDDGSFIEIGFTDGTLAHGFTGDDDV